MIAFIWFLIFLATAWILFYNRASMVISGFVFLFVLLVHDKLSEAGWFFLTIEWGIFIALFALLAIKPLRRELVTRHIFRLYKKLMPRMSRTEEEALNAGTVTWEGELFKGDPDWQKLVKVPKFKLSEEEQAFLDGPTDEVCAMTNDWEVTHYLADLPQPVWSYLKEKGFFGLIIPKKYGGKEFSAAAHSAIIAKLSSRSPTLSSVTAVPNSLGPAELLLHYGTEEQKNYYLPRLARGEEVPCFALTNPIAGSDAGSIPDHGFVCHAEFEGKEVLGIRVTWSKRYITLAPVATLLGLAFKLYDPDHILGDKVDIGITCALIPTTTPGIKIGRRHYPVHTPFQNGPTQGDNIFIPMDYIIGGVAMVGQGWKMLVESLSAGRAISLPSTSLGNMKLQSFVTGAYARIRKQFGVPIGRFEGVQEALARIIGSTYLIDSGVKFTMAEIDQGEKPAVPSAIMKYHATESVRISSNCAMDIHAGKGICLGPRNYLAKGHDSVPIGITVEGANILTRSLIIFGQGAIRCHPYIFTEMQAARDPDAQRGLIAFDNALFSHIGYSISNVFRTLFLSLTQGHFVKVPSKTLHHEMQKITQYSSSFALIADIAMLTLGGELKRRENLSARLGDVLSYLYLASTVCKKYRDDGYPASDKPLVDWSLQELFFKIEKQIAGLLMNLPHRWMGKILYALVFPFGRLATEASDELKAKVAEIGLTPSDIRDRLVSGIYLKPEGDNKVAQIGEALEKIIAVDALEKRVASAVSEGHVQGLDINAQIDSTLSVGIINIQEAEQMRDAEKARAEIIAVDDFSSIDLQRPLPKDYE